MRREAYSDEKNRKLNDLLDAMELTSRSLCSMLLSAARTGMKPPQYPHVTRVDE